jgi:RNA polymerase sigma-70 factor (ECF subfamily)
LVLKHIQGFSYREIAEILKLSPENVRIKVMRAKKTLYKKFIEQREVQ